MPWDERDIVERRHEYVELARQEGSNKSELCHRFGISRKTGYKWQKRYEEEGKRGLKNRSKEAHKIPHKTRAEVEEIVIQAREKHPCWGGRKLKRYLENQGYKEIPAASTITEILKREGYIDPLESERREAPKRFEYDAPNELWQMDFKGYFETDYARCYALTALDDHSRYSIILDAHPSQHRERVEGSLERAFRRYGLPRRMLMDNGGPWGQYQEGTRCVTRLAVWLIDLGIKVMHGRPFHPQTQGKEERFHRTLKREVLEREHYRDLESVQNSFDKWQEIYNCERPHEALGLEVPASRYWMSPRSYPEVIRGVEYDEGDYVRRADTKGYITFKGYAVHVGRAFYKRNIALRPDVNRDGVYHVYYRHQHIREIDLAGREKKTIN